MKLNAWSDRQIDGPLNETLIKKYLPDIESLILEKKFDNICLLSSIVEFRSFFWSIDSRTTYNTLANSRRIDLNQINKFILAVKISFTVDIYYSNWANHYCNICRYICYHRDIDNRNKEDNYYKINKTCK